MKRARFALKAMTFVLAVVAAGCAQQVGDIDRTQPNALEKAMFLDGEFYIRQTVSDVPATSSALFTGYTFDTERIRWVISEDYLMAYRSYEYVPGSSDRVAYDPEGNPVDSMVDDNGYIAGGGFYGQPIAAYPITSHFDIQRQYNSATGEQSNVISENTSDRPWYERDYMRVDWGSNIIDAWTFLDHSMASTQYVGEGHGGDDEIRFVNDEESGALEYMDFVTRLYMAPSLLACIYVQNGYGVGDCVGQQVEVRTSVLRVPDTVTYEPLYYDDVDMNRFGYFRTERVSYDRRRGATVDGRILLGNRHDIWVDAWQRNADGTVARDGEGNPLALPFAERQAQPIVYHLSPYFPEALLPYAAEMAEGWDQVFRRAVAAAQFDGDESKWQDVRPMFMLCQNPVTAAPVWPMGDEGLAFAGDCGEVGTEVLIGDLRYDVVYWVTNPQQSGPLGYGPSAADPVTGEIISGTAYVYGASVDTYAESSLDLIRFVNGDLEDDDLQDPEYIRNAVRERRQPVDPRMRGMMENPELANMDLQVDAAATLVSGEARERVMALREDFQADGMLDTLQQSAGWSERRAERIRESGVDLLAINDEQLAIWGHDPTQGVSDEQLEAVRLSTWMANNTPNAIRARENALSRDCVMLADSFDDAILGIARAYEGRTDYDVMYEEIRGLIFKAVMEHEVGHTIGLRHNFGASWDALNYMDEFWDAKQEGYPAVADDGSMEIVPFRAPQTLGEQFGIASQTDAQIDARMREYQYSSIMDYSSSFNTDFGGIGRYDSAAILYGYTSGAEGADVRQGYVEVWQNLPAAAEDLLRGFDERRGIGYYHPLEIYHYSTLVESMGSTPAEMVENLRDRSLVRLDDHLETFDGIEVPYIFCSDEFRGTRQHCRTWDRGADPMEQTLDYIDRYRGFYYFDTYRRERLGWFAGSAGSRIGGRLFFPLVDGYQRWLLNVAVNPGSRDPILENQWTFSAYAGLNLLAEAATTPNYGSYVLSDDGTEYQLISYGESSDADIYIPEGEGRRRWSRYDAGIGYNYARYPLAAGHYWTYVNALFALTSAETSFAGVEVGQFDTTYLIPPYLVFAEELTRLFNGIIRGDNRSFSPIATTTARGVALQYRPMLTLGLNTGDLMDPETGGIVDADLVMNRDPNYEPTSPVVDSRIGFSESVNALIFSMSSFTSNYSTRFVDQGRIFELRAGDILEVAEGYEIIQFCDPTPGGIGKCYAAYQSMGEGELSLAVDFVLEGQRLEAEWWDAIENNRDTSSLAFQIDDLLTDINIVRDLHDVFQRVF